MSQLSHMTCWGVVLSFSLVPITSTERSLAISMEMVMPERPPGCDEDYEDIDADVTTEHAF